MRIAESIREKEQEYEEISKDHKEIETVIAGVDDERVRHAEYRYQQSKKEKERLLSDIGMYRERLNEYQKEIESAKKKYEDEIAKIEKHDKVKNKIVFCNECIDAAREIMADIKEEIRSEIESKTKEQFLRTIWKKGSYRDVKLDSDYNIALLDQNNMECVGTLSAGERQLLALAFIDALHAVSGFDSPIIIDTPLGRISGEPKLNLAKVLPEYTKNKQVIMLVTDQEYTAEVRAALHPFVGKEYRIKFNEDEHGNRAEVVLI